MIQDVYVNGLISICFNKDNRHPSSHKFFLYELLIVGRNILDFSFSLQSLMESNLFDETG